MNGNQYFNLTIKTKSKKSHNSAKIWRMITNIELDLYFTCCKLLQTLNEINASLLKLMKKCDDDTDDDAAVAAAAADKDGQHDPYVSAMLGCGSPVAVAL